MLRRVFSVSGWTDPVTVIDLLSSGPDNGSNTRNTIDRTRSERTSVIGALNIAEAVPKGG